MLTAAFAALLLIVAPAGAKVDVPRASAPEVKAYSESFDVTRAVATERLELQTRGAAAHIGEALEEKLGDDYGGLWFDNDAGEYVIALASPQSARGADRGAVAGELGDASLDNGDYRTTIVDDSWSDMLDAGDRISDELESFIKQQEARISIDPITNAVKVGVRKGASESTVAAITRQTKNAGVDVQVETGEERQFEKKLATCSDGGTWEKSCSQPMRGGVGIRDTGHGTSRSHFCTSAFRARGKSDGKHYFLTAGHCVKELNEDEEEKWEDVVWDWETWDPVTWTGQSIGTLTQWYWPKHDWAKIDVTNTWGDASPWSSVAYWGRGEYGGIVEEEYAINAEAESQVGNQACHSGIATGTTCGHVIALEKSFNPSEGKEGTIVDTWEVENTKGGDDLCLEGGDSGGSVFANHYALGIVSFGIHGYCASGLLMNYVKIKEATEDLNVSLGPVGGAPGAFTNAVAGYPAPHQATASGYVYPDGLSTSYHFDYGKANGLGKPFLPYESSTSSGSAGSGYGVDYKTGTLTGLEGGTTYHFRIVAVNSAETAKGVSKTFTTPIWKPLITPQSPTEVKAGHATLNAQVNPQGSATAYRFEWGKASEGFPNSIPVPDASVGSGGSNVAVAQDITGLDGLTEYHYRVIAANEEGTTTSSTQTFTTPDWSPAVTTEGAEEVSPHIYKLHAKINPKGFSTEYGFEYGEDDSYGSEIEAEGPLTGEGDQEVGLEIDNLKGETVYHYRAFATNEGNGASQTNHGEDKTFTTPDYRPAVVTKAATAMGTFETSDGERYSTATLHGTVNPKARDATYRFEYGTSPAALSSSVPIPDGEIEAGIEDVEVSAALDDLVPRTIYYYRLRADNEEGHHVGEIVTFTTPEWAIADVEDPAGEKRSSALPGVSCTSATVCVAVGSYADEEGTDLTLAQHRDGGQWRIEPTPNPEGATEAKLTAVSCAAADACVATGHYENGSGQVEVLAERWDGSSWSILPAPNPEGSLEAKLVSVSCVAADDCTAVGRYKTGSEAFSTLIERWDGSAWSIVSSPDAEGLPKNYLSSVSCPSADDCWAVGHSAYTQIEQWEGKSPQALALRFDGEAWSIASVGAEPPNLLTDVSCSSSSFCMIAANGLELLVHDGESWSSQTASQPAGTDPRLVAVSCASATACTAVGSYLEGGSRAPLAERFDGTEWTLQEATDPDDVLEDVSFFGSLESVSCATASACAATGYTVTGIGLRRNLVVETHPPGDAPDATTEPATDTEAPIVTLNATVNPGGEDTAFQFEYAAEGEYDPESEDPYGEGGVVPQEPRPIGSATKGIAVAEQLGSLELGTTYHFRVVAENGQGTDAGEDVTFTTRHSPRLEAAAYPASIAGSQEQGAELVLSFDDGSPGSSFECGEASLAGDLPQASAALALTPSYTDCKAFGFSNPTVAMNGCEYLAELDESPWGPDYTSSLAIDCPEGKAIEVSSFTCKVEIPAQEGLSTLTWATDPEAEPSALSLDFDVAGLQYTKTDGFLCPLQGSGSMQDGRFTGSATFSGEDGGGAPVWLAVSGIDLEAHPPQLEAEAYPASIAGSQEQGAELVLSFDDGSPGSSLECDEASLAGDLPQASAALALTPSYTDCKAFGFSNPTVAMNGCEYLAELDESPWGPDYTSSLAIDCPEGKAIEINVFTCKVEIPAQEGLSILTWATDPEAEPSALSLDFDVAELQYTKTDGFLCPLQGSGSMQDGRFTGSATFSGEDGGGAPVGIRITGSE